MKSSNMIVWVVGAVILIGILGWAVSRVVNKDSTGTPGANTATTTDSTSTPPVSTGTKTVAGGKTVAPTSQLMGSYTDATYFFKISYPREFKAEPFGVFHMLNNNDWRIGATSAKRGTPIISVPVLRMDNGSYAKKYPLFFAAEVRIGVSTDTAQCYAKDDGYTTQTVTDVNINGVIWKKFIFGDAATMQYINGASYRTIRNNKCYVVEQVRTGSSYRDDTMAEVYSDKQLDAIYAKTTPIVMSFRFTK